MTVTKGGVRKVAGYDCQDYTLALGSLEHDDSSARRPPSRRPPRRSTTASTPRSPGMANNPMFKSFAKLADEMKKIQGFTLAESTSLKMMGMSVQSSREATEVKKGAIAASAFDLAAIAPGYKKVAHPMTKMK